MGEYNNYNESHTIGDFYFYNDGTLAIRPESENNFTIEDRMLLYKQYFGNSTETSYVSFGSVLACSKGSCLSRLGANEVAQVFVGNNIPVLTCKDREVGSNIFTFGICNCKGKEKKCNPVINEDWKQAGNNRAMIYKASSDEFFGALKSCAITICSAGDGGYIKVAQVNEPEQNATKEEPIVLGSPEYMDAFEDFLEDALRDIVEKGGWLLSGEERKIMQAETGIKKIMYDVNNYSNTNKISDDYWLTLCKRFNELVIRCGGVYEELHFFRNKLNRAPKTLDEMITTNKSLASEKKWRLLPVDESLYHMFGEDGEYNLKFVSADGLFEGVYNKSGYLLTKSNDPINMGTYNYYDPADKIQHGRLDVLPYETWGNVPGVLKPGSPFANEDKYNANKNAQKHYDNIKSQI